MRLLLASSEPTPQIAAELARLAGARARVGIVLNASDDGPDDGDGDGDDGRNGDPRTERLQRQRLALTELGESAVELDLRAEGAMAVLEAIDVIWVAGGNWHALWRAMALVAEAIVARVRDGALVYGGWSAGAVVAGPLVVENGTPAWGGLGLIDVMVVPHYGSDEGVARIVSHLRATEQRYVALRDGHALVMDGAGASLIGR